MNFSLYPCQGCRRSVAIFVLTCASVAAVVRLTGSWGNLRTEIGLITSGSSHDESVGSLHQGLLQASQDLLVDHIGHTPASNDKRPDLSAVLAQLLMTKASVPSAYHSLIEIIHGLGKVELPTPLRTAKLPGQRPKEGGASDHLRSQSAAGAGPREQSRRLLRELQEKASQLEAAESISVQPAASITRTSDNTDLGPPDLSLTIFTAPYPFSSSPSDPQRIALRSWLALNPSPQVVLLGNHPSFSRIAQEFPDHVSVEPQIDSNFRGVPLLHSMLARAQVADTDWTMLIRADAVLSQKLSHAVRKVRSHFVGSREELFLVATCFEHGQHPPGSPFSLNTLGEPEGGMPDSVANHRTTPQQDADIFLWNRPGRPLHTSVTPPFSYGRGSSSAWLVNEVATAGLREVVDITQTARPYRLTRAASPGESEEEREDEEELKRSQLRVWNQPKVAKWEVRVNRQLAEAHGTCSTAKDGSELVHVPWTLVPCREQQGGDLCFVKRGNQLNCALAELDGMDAPDSSGELNISGDSRGGRLQSGETVARGQLHTPEELLPQVADESKMVILVAVSHAYFSVLMSFVCQLRHLGLPPPLVAAMDEELYNLAYQQGLPVFYQLAKVKKKKNCEWGTKCFAKTTKVKSRAVLRILKLGYTVLWTDVDIWWFKDPRPGFQAFGPGVLPIQSEEFNATEPANNRINSGLYYARPEPQIVDVFERVVARAAASDATKSEQPSFDEELCGGRGEQRSGDNECVHPNGLKIVFLDRILHPNGLYRGYWYGVNATQACSAVGCETLHNNYSKGLTTKIARFKKHKLWRYNEKEGLCIHEWSPEQEDTRS